MRHIAVQCGCYTAQALHRRMLPLLPLTHTAAVTATTGSAMHMCVGCVCLCTQNLFDFMLETNRPGTILLPSKLRIVCYVANHTYSKHAKEQVKLEKHCLFKIAGTHSTEAREHGEQTHAMGGNC